MSHEGNGRHWVLWDGDCGFCRRSTTWLEKLDSRQRLRFVPYQQAPAPPMTPELRRACRDAVHVVTVEGEVLRAGRAALFLLEHTRYRRLARTLSQPVFLWLVEIGYHIIARNRLFFSRFLFRAEP